MVHERIDGLGDRLAPRQTMEVLAQQLGVESPGLVEVQLRALDRGEMAPVEIVGIEIEDRYVRRAVGECPTERRLARARPTGDSDEENLRMGSADTHGGTADFRSLPFRSRITSSYRRSNSRARDVHA